LDTIFPDPSLVWMLRRVVGVGLLYHLYANDRTPGLVDTLASYTEALWSGYAPLPVLAADWIISGVAQHVGDLEALPLAFYNTSPADVVVYGYFVTDDTGTQLVCAARFDQAPVTILRGTFYPVAPLLGSYSGLSS
jgi:hypothetical protein